MINDILCILFMLIFASSMVFFIDKLEKILDNLEKKKNPNAGSGKIIVYVETNMKNIEKEEFERKELKNGINNEIVIKENNICQNN